MREFKEWFEELKSNTFFWDRMHLKHGSRKNLTTIAENVFNWLVAKEMLDKPMPECRTAYMKFAESHPNDAVQIQVMKQEAKVEVVKPLTGEERQRRLAEWKEAVQSSPLVKPAFKPTSKQIEEEGQVRPKATQFHRSELDTRIAAIESVKHLRAARRQTFLTAFPNADEAEVNAYVMKFDEIDNPNGLKVSAD